MDSPRPGHPRPLRITRARRRLARSHEQSRLAAERHRQAPSWGREAGAKGFLLKDAGPDLLVHAIRAAADGDALVAPSVTARLLAQLADSAPICHPRQPIVSLTEREEEIAITVTRGKSNAEIAAELHISLSTVKFHIASLMTKIGARNRVDRHLGLRNKTSAALTMRVGLPGLLRWVSVLSVGEWGSSSQDLR